MEIKGRLKELCGEEEVVVNEKFGIKIKKRLSTDDMQMIVANVVECSDAVEATVVRDMAVISKATDIEDLNTFTSEDYDYVRKSGLLDLVEDTLENYFDLIDLINEATSVKFTVKRFCDDIMKLSDTAMKGLPKTSKGWNKLVENIGKAINTNENLGRSNSESNK